MKNALTALLKAHGKIDAAKHLDLLKIKCFSRDTLVHTATEPRPIGEIGPGEQIWSYHFERGVWGLCEVKERLDNTYSGPVVSITVDNTTIEATAYHPFWVIDGRDLQERSKPRELQEHEDEGHSLLGRWVNSHELRAGDCIITRSGTRALITEIRQRFDDAFPVSNLSIIGHHNYAVGDVGVLVHNITVCEGTIADLRKAFTEGTSEDEIWDLLRSKTDKDGNRLYSESDIDKAMGEILSPRPGIDVGEYRVVGGHHVHAKAGFDGHGTYDLNQGFSISQDYIKRRGWNHQDMTNKQRELFGELARSGRENSLAEHTRIAEEALVAGGATREEAQALVQESLRDLAQQGVIAPTHIPWKRKAR